MKESLKIYKKIFSKNIFLLIYFFQNLKLQTETETKKITFSPKFCIFSFAFPSSYFFNFQFLKVLKTYYYPNVAKNLSCTTGLNLIKLLGAYLGA